MVQFSRQPVRLKGLRRECCRYEKKEYEIKTKYDLITNFVHGKMRKIVLKYWCTVLNVEENEMKQQKWKNGQHEILVI